MPLTPAERKQRYDAKKRDIRQKAQQLATSIIRNIVNRDKILFNSLFAYPVIIQFSIDKAIKRETVILLMVMDLYVNFAFKEAKLWGLYKRPDYFRKAILTLMDEGYIIQGNKKPIGYYMTLKGKNFIKEFNKYYDEHVKKVFASIGNRNREEYRKVTRIKSARVYKPYDQSTGDKPKGNSHGGRPGSSDRREGLGQRAENG